MNKDFLKENSSYNFIEIENKITIEILSGGTSSKIFHVSTVKGANFIIKVNKNIILENEVRFLKLYESFPLFPKLLTYSPDFSYIIYEYVEGSVKKEIDKLECLLFLVNNVLNKYKKTDKQTWGELDSQVDTWEQFLKQKKKEVDMYIRNISTLDLIFSIDNILNDIALVTKKQKEPYLLHGDLGIYNIIFNNLSIQGIIDPMPINGIPIYDLIFAYFSTPYDIKNLYILDLIDLLNYNESFSYEYKLNEIIFGLYFRVGRCMKHHPKDIHFYLDAFHFWQDKLYQLKQKKSRIIL